MGRPIRRLGKKIASGHLSALKTVLKMDDTMDRRRQQAEAERQALEAERRRQIEALGHAPVSLARSAQKIGPTTAVVWRDRSSTRQT